MRQIFLLLSVLLLGLTWAVAQDTTGQTGSQTSAGGEMTVQGCLSGSSGSYTLTDKHGMAYQLTGDTAKLSEHVGHEVKITGTSSSEASSAGASSGTSSAAGSTGAQKTLQVSSVKHVSKTCQSAGAMSH
jgi:hypothetical protein